MLLYISQNADMSEKWRHFGIIMTSYWFIIVTFIFQFIICDSLKETACQYLYFKILLYISQNADMSGKLRYFDIMMTSYWSIIVTFVFKFLICDFLKETAFQYLYFKILQNICQNADMSGKRRHFGIMMTSFWFVNIIFLFQFSICDNLKETPY